MKFNGWMASTRERCSRPAWSGASDKTDRTVVPLMVKKRRKSGQIGHRFRYSIKFQAKHNDSGEIADPLSRNKPILRRFL